jgi:GNAT superfamily N-acetyltransferase
LEEWRRDEFLISMDKSRVDIPAVTKWLATESYWAEGISSEIVAKAIANSDVYGVYHEPDGRQAGFARVVTDHATCAYLCDVFIMPEFQGRGLGIWLMEVIWNRPEMLSLRTWSLATRDAHGLYEKFGFETVTNNRWMARRLRTSYLP